MSKNNDLIMTRAQVEQSVRSTMAIQARRRLERKLAESLAVAINLSKGTGLVMCLGDGRETSNVEALTGLMGYSSVSTSNATICRSTLENSTPTR